MVGKPNFPVDYDQNTSLSGASMVTSGLDPLDQEREASMADEGGVSGAEMEKQDPPHSGEVIELNHWRRMKRKAAQSWSFSFRDHKSIKVVFGLLIVFGIVGVGLSLRKYMESWPSEEA